MSELPETFTPRPYQAEAIKALIAGWEGAHNRLAVVLPTGCHRTGQHVLMHDGTTKAVEDVQVGDQLMGPDSTPRHVLQLARGTGRMVEIRPNRGTPWAVNDEHVLTLVETQARAAGTYLSERGGAIRDVEVRNWEGWSATRKHRHKLFRVAVDFPVRPAPKLDPYFLGILIGDGSLSVPYRVSVATIDPEIAAACEQIAEQYGLTVRVDGRNGIQHNITSGTRSGGRRGSNPIAKMLRSLGLSPIACADRFVPEDYRLGSRAVRREILAGLIDSDGSRSRGGYEFASKSRRLAADVAFIARSLGLAAYVSTRANGHHRVSISGDCAIIPVRIPRKVVPPRVQKKDVLRTGFTAVPTGTVEQYYGFTLSGDHRYLLDDFTVTHNSGKTVVFANLISQMLGELDGQRALVIAHREELIQQAAAKVRAVCPDLRVGIVKAQRDDHQDVDVIVASIQTLAVERRRNAIRDIGLIIVDECHHAAAPTYLDVLEHFGAWRAVPVAGFTATMTRTDGGLAEVWEEVVFTLDILEMIEDGYLCDVRGKRVTVPGLALDDVKFRGGDFQDGQLGQALDDSGAAEVVAEAYRLHAVDRPGVAFTPTVETAQSMADSFSSAGIPAAAIWGDMSRDDRAAALEKYRRGDVQVLTNCMVLTEGFDAPWTSCVVIARPTKSAGLYCQMAGRALRLSPETGKKDALILDVMGASTRHRLASIVDLTGRPVVMQDEEQTLREAVREAEEKTKRHLDLSRIQVEEIDLFHGSSARWLKTASGIWFIPVADATYVFLVRNPVDRTYWLRRLDLTNGIVGPKNDVPLSLPVAKAWLEQQARAMGGRWLATRAAAWRDKPASVKQVNYCRLKGIQVPHGSSAGEVSDLQAIHQFTTILNQLNARAAA